LAVFQFNSVFNAGATLPGGMELPCCFAAVEDRRGCRICAPRARRTVLMDGKFDREPTLMPDAKDFPEENLGIEDPRITFVPELQQYVGDVHVVFAGWSRSVAGTDQRIFERSSAMA